jgi:hypothetical protein
MGCDAVVAEALKRRAAAPVIELPTNGNAPVMNRGDPPTMRLALITDAWEPQTNGVFSTLRHTCRELEARGVTQSEAKKATKEGFKQTS